ncbi:MAG: hypothetical protein K8I00_13365, partial [Candidatus Omnitrophica bacterium]|nr:hypothetical protein [Candidatus Omnitrophota bacterium]
MTESTERLIVEHMNRTHVTTMNVSIDAGTGYEIYEATAFEQNDDDEEVVVAASAAFMVADNLDKAIELNMGGQLTFGQKMDYSSNLISIDQTVDPNAYFDDAPIAVSFIEHNETSGNYKRRIEEITNGTIQYKDKFKFSYDENGQQKRTFVMLDITKKVDEFGDMSIVNQILDQAVTIAGVRYERGTEAQFFDHSETEYRDLMHSFSLIGNDLVIHENRAIKTDEFRRFRLSIEQRFTSQLKMTGIVYEINAGGVPEKAFVEVKASEFALKLINFHGAEEVEREEKTVMTKEGAKKRATITVRITNAEFERALELDDKRANDNKFVGYFQKWNLYMQKLRGAAIKISDIDPKDPVYASYYRAAQININRIEKILENKDKLTEAFAALMQDLLNMMYEALDANDSSIDILALVELGAQETIGMMDQFKSEQRRMFDRRVYQQIVTHVAPYFGDNFASRADQRMIQILHELDAQPGQAQYTQAQKAMKDRLAVVQSQLENMDMARPYSQKITREVNRILIANGFDINFAAIRDLAVFKGMNVTQRIIFEHLLKSAFPAGFADEDNNNVILTRASDLNDGFLKDLGRNPEAMQGDKYTDERRAEAMLHELIGLHLVGGTDKTEGQIQRRTDAQNIILQRK